MKEYKVKAKERFKVEKNNAKELKASFKGKSGEEIKLAKKEAKSAKKIAKAERKDAISKMSDEQKKLAKKEDKYIKKLKRRPVKYTILGIIAILLLIVILLVKDTVGDIFKTFGAANGLDIDNLEAQKVRNEAEAIADEVTDEGIVLLKNKDDLLPLMDKKVNVFGLSSLNIRYGGGGSGGTDTSRAIDLYTALSEVGIEYNQELYEFNKKELEIFAEAPKEGESTSGLSSVLSAMFIPEIQHEPEISYLTDDVIASAKEYSDTALIVLTSDSVEASDASPKQLHIVGEKMDLIDRVCADFENVILVVNAGNAINLSFVDEHEYINIKSVVWIGTPGARGTLSLAKILNGDVNPSGRITDTYVTEIKSAPSTRNFGDYKYTNLDNKALLEYEEGIYVGYRYYETKYLGDAAGYKEAVQYPFGHGLSYTEFQWDAAGFSFDKDTVSLHIQVKNIGDVAGKDVVQVYFTPPYTEGGIEKAAVELAGYKKTKLLAPGEAEVVVVSFNTRDMASYDMINEQAFVLEKGNYVIKASKNAHLSGLEFPMNIKADIVYKTDEITGTEIENQFEYANGDLTYLSRSNWETTYPTNSDVNVVASQELIDNYFAKDEKAEGEMPLTGQKNGIMLVDLKGLDKDDVKWEEFLDQFKINEMIELVANGGYRTTAFKKYGVPDTVLLDGPAGINFFFKSFTAASYPTELLIASTWNDDLAYKVGESVGKEAKAIGVTGWYAPAMNIHRSALGGRNFEYFSEDPLLSGKMGASITRGAQSQDILVFMKHFILNEQEINARSGVLVWANEQAIRELYLRPFEITVKEANVTGVMSSFIYVGHKWSGGNENLLQNVLRDEWGFDGIVSTDAFFGFMDPVAAIKNGNELLLTTYNTTAQEKKLKEAYKEDKVGMANALRDRTKTILYTFLEYTDIVE